MTYIAPKSEKNQSVHVELKHLIAKSTVLSYSLHNFHSNILLLPQSLCSLYLANSILIPGLLRVLTVLCVTVSNQTEIICCRYVASLQKHEAV